MSSEDISGEIQLPSSGDGDEGTLDEPVSETLVGNRHVQTAEWSRCDHG